MSIATALDQGLSHEQLVEKGKDSVVSIGKRAGQ